jgi:hypothetical protein
MTPYLSICSIYRDHAEYLREWIEFHRLAGVERFFLYDNESKDDHRKVLAPYVERGTVEIHDWPSPASVERGVPWGIIGAFNDCLERHRSDSRWVAFIDIDEFLFSPTGKALPEVLAGYEQYPGVCVTRADFGTSGHHHKPPGLVTESYLRRRSYPPGVEAHMKSIVDPARVVRCRNAHWFDYADDESAVDENEQPVASVVPFTKSQASLSLLRINHYVTKSEEEFRRKQAQWAAAGRPLEPGSAWFETMDSDFDEAITAYLPPLRDALGRA